MIQYEHITVTPLSPAVGAVISGPDGASLDVGAGVGDEQLAEIRTAYADRGVIFFRDQALSPEQHIEWVER
ncbi:MAG: taurine dioxygenase [Candidatus Poriferisodalaceae bacterium]|jgi:taurine dioxygenase